MHIYEKLNFALATCDLPLLKHKTAYRKLGAGAWHDAYLVYPQQGGKLVVRLRKQVIYGKTESPSEKELHEDYGPVGIFYDQANQIRPSICPVIYEYRLTPNLNFTIESYQGPTLSIPALTKQQAFDYGQQVGEFFRELYITPTTIPGFGELIWDGQGFIGEDQRELTIIWSEKVEQLQTQLEALINAEPNIDWLPVRERLDWVLQIRNHSQEPIVLINGDITPENFTTRRGKFRGLIDPVPRLHNAYHYAAFFAYCYKSYLINLADAPRYIHHYFDQFKVVLNAIGDGFISSYANKQQLIQQQLEAEYFLWSLHVAYENLHRLNTELTPEIYLRAGDKPIIQARFRRCLQELGGLAKIL